MGGGGRGGPDVSFILSKIVDNVYWKGRSFIEFQSILCHHSSQQSIMSDPPKENIICVQQKHCNLSFSFFWDGLETTSRSIKHWNRQLLTFGLLELLFFSTYILISCYLCVKELLEVKARSRADMLAEMPCISLLSTLTSGNLAQSLCKSNLPLCALLAAVKWKTKNLLSTFMLHRIFMEKQEHIGLRMLSS